MYSTKNTHDVGVNCFSPEGHIYQILYAMTSINLSSTSIGICCKEGIVFVSEKRSCSPLRCGNGITGITKIDEHVSCAIAGYVADSRILVDSARTEAQNHRFVYEEPIPIRALTESTSDIMINFGKGKNKLGRPFGVSLLIGGFDNIEEDEDRELAQSLEEAGAQGLKITKKLYPKLFCTQPSGSYARVKAKANGAGATTALNLLETRHAKSPLDRMSLNEAVSFALEILSEVMENKISSDNVELTTITAQDFDAPKVDTNGEINPDGTKITKVVTKEYKTSELSKLIEQLGN